MKVSPKFDHLVKAQLLLEVHLELGDKPCELVKENLNGLRNWRRIHMQVKSAI